MPRTSESSYAGKNSIRTALRTYTVSFDAKSDGCTINFYHTVEAVDASQAVGSAINACRKHHIGVSVDLKSIVVNCKNW